MQYRGTNSLTYSEVPLELSSSVTSVVSTQQQLMQSVGVALCALLLRFFSPHLRVQFLTTVLFHHAFLVLGMVAILPALVFLKLHAEDGSNLL
jgi:hypothetical protein